MADEMSVTLPEGVLKPIIQAQIVSALQGQERLIREMVTQVLNQQVQDKQTYERMPLLEYTARALLREAVEASVREWIASQREQLQALVAQQLRAQAKGIASRLVSAVADEATSKWQLTVKVQLGEK